MTSSKINDILLKMAEDDADNISDNEEDGVYMYFRGERKKKNQLDFFFIPDSGVEILK